MEKNTHQIEVDLKGTSVLAYDYAVLKSFYFKNSSQTDNKAFGSIGLWFQEQPLIMIGVSPAGQESRSWLPKAILKERENFSDTKYSDPPYADKLWYKEDVWSRMKQIVMQEFLDTDNIERQKELLEAFIDEFLGKVKLLLH